MAKWVIWNNTQNRLEVQSVFANQTDSDNAITRLKKSRPPRSSGPVESLVSKQVD
jgi:hypothetical protein